MGMIFMTVERVLHFILKAIWKLLCVAGALVVCAIKGFLMTMLFIFHYNGRTGDIVENLGLYPKSLQESLKIGR